METSCGSQQERTSSLGLSRGGRSRLLRWQATQEGPSLGTTEPSTTLGCWHSLATTRALPNLLDTQVLFIFSIMETQRTVSFSGLFATIVKTCHFQKCPKKLKSKFKFNQTQHLIDVPFLTQEKNSNKQSSLPIVKGTQMRVWLQRESSPSTAAPESGQTVSLPY